MLDPNIQLQVGDLVDCAFYSTVRNWGVIEEIAENPNGHPMELKRELMYAVTIQGDSAPIWLHRWEIFAVLDPETAFRETVEFYYERILGRRRAAWNNLVRKVCEERGTEVFKGVL